MSIRETRPHLVNLTETLASVASMVAMPQTWHAVSEPLVHSKDNLHGLITQGTQNISADTAAYIHHTPKLTPNEKQ